MAQNNQNIYFLALNDPNDAKGGTQIVPAANFNFIIGQSGSLNLASNSFVTGVSSVVVGGYGNLASGNGITIAGGCFNDACANNSSIGGGSDNKICRSSNNSAIGGGNRNCTLNSYNFIGAGTCNFTNGLWAAIVAGSCNISSGSNAFVGGGFANCNLGCNSIIGAGLGNKITSPGEGHAILGGCLNCISPLDNFSYSASSTIAGGYFNAIRFTSYSFIGGGERNCISQTSQPISNYENKYNSILGGYANYICRSSYNSIIGSNNCISCCNNNSFIIGYNSRINHSGAGIISDGTSTIKNSQGPNTLTLDFISGTYIKNKIIFQNDNDVPLNHTSFGISGQISYDKNYLYRHNGDYWTKVQMATGDNQTIIGTKNFTTTPQVNGIEVAISNNVVDLSLNQNIGGIKTFISAPIVSGNPLITGNLSLYATTGNLSLYATVINLASTGSTLVNSINSLSGTLTGNYVTKFNGQFTNRPTVNGTGVLLIGEPTQNTVFTTGDQTISGVKTFVNTPQTVGGGLFATEQTAVVIFGDQYVNGLKDFYIRPKVNGTGVLLSGEAIAIPISMNGSQQGKVSSLNFAGAPISVSIAGTTATINVASPSVQNGVYTTGNQTISGIKTFATEIFAPNLVYNTGNQTISGVKNFFSRVQVNGTGVLLSGEGIPSPIAIFNNGSSQGNASSLNFAGAGISVNTAGAQATITVTSSTQTTTIPTSSNSAGVSGSFAISDDYFYFCKRPNKWVRTALSEW